MHRAVYTHNDLDGLVSALLARVAMPDADVLFCDYAALPEMVAARADRYDTVWFADLSIREESLFDGLREHEVEVSWFDHHASSLEQDWMAECRIDTSGDHCAADIVRAYVEELGFEIPVEVQTLCDYAHDQDLWVRKLPDAQRFNDILGQMRVFDLFCTLTEDLGRVYHWTAAMTAASEATATERAWSIQLATQTSVYTDLPDGHRLRAACCWGSVSEVGDALGEPDMLVALIDLRGLDHRSAKCSLRTQSDEIQANQIAEQLGGGGHPKASGAPLELDVLKALSGELLEQVLAAARSAGEQR